MGTLEVVSDPILGDVLARPMNAVLYELSRALRAAYPDRWVLETDDYSFDFRDFAAAGHCRISDAKGHHTHRKTGWSSYLEASYDQLTDAWLTVEWEGHEMLLVATGVYPDSSCRDEWRFLLAPSEEVGRGFFEAVCRWSDEIRGEVLVFDQGYWRKSEELFKSIKGTTLDNLVLPAALKDEVRENVAGFFRAQETYERYGLPWKRGLLFLGPPGNGKTHMIKGLANELGRPVLYVRSFMSRRGTEHENIGAAFERARAAAPCLFVLEDLDALVDDDNRSYFLNEMDGFYSNKGILTVATTNHPEKLDPAILERPSRFDRKFTFTLPEEPERLRYLQGQNAGLEKELRMSYPGLVGAAKATEGFSYAYLKELVLSSMMAWIREEGKRPMEEVLSAQVASLAGQMRTEMKTPPVRRRAMDYDMD